MNMPFRKMLSILASCAVLFGGRAFAETHAASTGVPAMTSSKATVRRAGQDTRRRCKWTIRSIRLLAWSSIAAICVTWAGVCYDYPDNPSDAGGSMPDSPVQVNQARADGVSADQLQARESRVVSLDQRESMGGSQL